jgi:hypothetical protein
MTTTLADYVVVRPHPEGNRKTGRRILPLAMASRPRRARLRGNTRGWPRFAKPLCDAKQSDLWPDLRRAPPAPIAQGNERNAPRTC